MTPESKKNMNVAAGIVFSILGLACFVIAFYVASVPGIPKPAPVHMAPVVSEASCRDTLAMMGYVTENKSGGGLKAKAGSLTDPQAALLKATAAVGLCRLKLVEFCMGSTCEGGGLTFTLAPAPKLAPVVAAPSSIALNASSAPSVGKKQ
jgi:hypothetical protein